MAFVLLSCQRSGLDSQPENSLRSSIRVIEGHETGLKYNLLEVTVREEAESDPVILKVNIGERGHIHSCAIVGEYFMVKVFQLTETQPTDEVECRFYLQDILNDRGKYEASVFIVADFKKNN